MLYLRLTDAVWVVVSVEVVGGRGVEEGVGVEDSLCVEGSLVRPEEVGIGAAVVVVMESVYRAVVSG